MQYPDIVPNREPVAPRWPARTAALGSIRRGAAVIRLKGEFEEATTKRGAIRCARRLATVAADAGGRPRGPQVVVNGGRPLSPEGGAAGGTAKEPQNSLRLKYTEQHPDVIATRQAMAQVQAEG